jgi:SagB-type dehydrogenase family enzyme
MKLKLPERENGEKRSNKAEAPLKMLFSPAEIYHENSKLRTTDMSLYAWISFVSSSPDIRNIISKPFSHYEGYKSIPLSKNFSRTSLSFEEVVINRRSVRDFTGDAMSLETLAKILFLGDGVVKTMHFSDGANWPVRTAPSGGGLFPIEMHAVVMNVKGLSQGLYIYNPEEHALKQILEKDLTDYLVNSSPAMEQSIRKASVCIILNAIVPRQKFKYGERAYRFALLEAGHITQNILLAAQAENLGAVAVGGYLDDDIDRLLSLDGVEEVSLYMTLIGCPK